LTSDDNKNASNPKRNNRPARSRGQGSENPAFERSDKPGIRARQAAAKMLAAVVDRKTSLDGMLDAETEIRPIGTQ
jgi:16S rRNA (cytosine967-C5)-methyltransferase